MANEEGQKDIVKTKAEEAKSSSCAKGCSRGAAEATWTPQMQAHGETPLEMGMEG
jgi:hypothetical protein